MFNNQERLIFHIDVNSAYLSWTAVKLLQYGGELDIRDVTSVIGGSEENRHGIILAASIPTKKLLNYLMNILLKFKDTVLMNVLWIALILKRIIREWQ